MRKKSFFYLFFASLLFSILILIPSNIILTKLVRDKFLEQILEQNDSICSNLMLLVRNDLINGDIRYASNMLAKAISPYGIKGFQILSSDKTLLTDYNYYPTPSNSLILQKEIRFSADSHIWGYINFSVDLIKFENKLSTITKYQNLILFIFFITIFSVCILALILILKTANSFDSLILNDTVTFKLGIIERVFWEKVINKLILAKSQKILLEQQLLEQKSQISFANLSKQVAHDIRSPLSALNMITSSLDEVTAEKRELIKCSIQRINDIANDLLKKGKRESANFTEAAPVQVVTSSLLIAPIIDSIVSEKRIQYKNLLNIEITSETSGSFNLFSQINESEIKRVLSNLINNSVEAINLRPGKIILKLIRYESCAVIILEDNGPGIPQYLLKNLGLEPVSYGKEDTESGSGLGVFHAKRTIEKFHGSFKIESILNNGTKIYISLPLALKPAWFLDEIKIKEHSSIVVCDDDASIHSLWRERLSEISLRVQFFSSLSTLKAWLNSNTNSDFLLLMDYEFSDNSENGLNFIIKHNLNLKSILVTSHYDEPQIIQTCIENEIKQIPKNICAIVPINFSAALEYYDAIVLDDEELQSRVWQFAAIQKGKKIMVLDNSDRFFEFIQRADSNSPVYIDSILGENIKGEDIAKKAYDLGFKNVYMSSGHDPSHFLHLTFLKGVIGKTPKFES